VGVWGLPIAAVLLPLTAAAQPVVVCRVPGDAARREWRLQRSGPDTAPSWAIAFSSAALDRPAVELPLPRAAPSVTANRVTLSYHSANGGRSVEWVADLDGPSSLDLHVNHGLEVNVERDLDPAVERMNTDGPIGVACERPGGAAGAAPRSSEWMIGAGAAWSIPLFDSAGGRGYVVQSVSWGRELTFGGGPGLLRGRFVWALEVTPLYAQWSPSSAYGAGISPLFWRWNFEPRGRWGPFAELSMGGLWTSAPVPEGTSKANFMAHAGFGTRVRASPRLGLVVAFRFQHISNGNQVVENPGVNAPMVWGGLSVK
jgi:hypothetical protein